MPLPVLLMPFELMIRSLTFRLTLKVLVMPVLLFRLIRLMVLSIRRMLLVLLRFLPTL